MSCVVVTPDAGCPGRLLDLAVASWESLYCVDVLCSVMRVQCECEFVTCNELGCMNPCPAILRAWMAARRVITMSQSTYRAGYTNKELLFSSRDVQPQRCRPGPLVQILEHTNPLHCYGTSYIVHRTSPWHRLTDFPFRHLSK